MNPVVSVGVSPKGSTNGVLVAFDGWDDDAGWYESDDLYIERKSVPVALWRRYQEADDAAVEARDRLRDLSDEISRTGTVVAALCRHAGKGWRWSQRGGLIAVCGACGEESPWADECPHPFYESDGDLDMCGVCRGDLPYVVVPLSGGPHDGETTHFHGEYKRHACQILLKGTSDNYYLRQRDNGLVYEYASKAAS